MAEEKKQDEQNNDAAEPATETTKPEAEKAPEAEVKTEETSTEEATDGKAESTDSTEEVTPDEEKAEAAADEVIPTAEEISEEEVVELPHRDIKPGMLVRVHERIIDISARGEERQRTQVFEGLVLGMRGGQESRSMTVRKNANGWMVEKIFPLSSPNVEKVEVVKQYRTKRAKLSYLRGRFRRKLKEVK